MYVKAAFARPGLRAAAALVALAACAPDPGELPPSCDPRELGAGEVRVRQIACTDELRGGEGAVGDWLLQNAVASFVVRDTYASLTQLGEGGGTLVDAVPVGGVDLLMELMPRADRATLEAVTEPDAVELRAPGVVYRLEADAPALGVTGPDGEPLAAVWVPRPGADHVDAVARSGTGFFALALAAPLAEEADGHGMIEVEGLTGVALDPAARWPEGTPLAEAVGGEALDADELEVRVGDRVVDRVPVFAGVAEGVVPAGATLTGARAGCVYDGLVRGACGGLRVWVRDEDGDPLAATVHFAGADFPLAAGVDDARLGPVAGEVWVWAGPRHSAWRGWFGGGEEELRLTLDTVLPAEAEWPEGGGDFPAAGARLAAFGVEVAPDADHGDYSADRLHRLRAEGVGYANALADAEFPVMGLGADDDVVLSSGSRVGGDVWAWGWSPTPRRAGHGAIDDVGFGALDRATLARGGAGADRFVVVRPEWVTAALAEAPAWAWPVPPDALWLDGPADIPTLATLASAWVDAQPLAERVWLPHEGVANLAVAHRALYERTASAGNGPRVDVEVLEVPGLRMLEVQVYTPGWMGAPTATLHSPAGDAALALDADGHAAVALGDAQWAFVSVAAPRSRPWGGDPAWAVSAVRFR